MGQPQSKDSVYLVERRKYPRFSVELPLDYSLVDAKETRGGTVANAGEGGILAYLHERIEIGTRLNVEILFAKGTELGSMKGMAKVIWSESAPKGTYKHGLAFQTFQGESLERLKRLLREIGKGS